MNKVQEIKKELQRLEMRKTNLKKELYQHIKATILQVAEEHDAKLTRISPNIIIIKYSDLIGNPWSPHFYDWKQAAKNLLGYLDEKVKAEDWFSFLNDLLKKREGNTTTLDYRWCFMGVRGVDKLYISAEFIEKVVKKLEEC